MEKGIILITEDRLREIIKESIPNAEKLSPEERYVTSSDLAKILKVSVSHLHYFKELGMWGYCGENLWEWQESIRWKTEVYSQITKSNRRKPSK